MAQREWGRNIGAENKEKKTETEMEKMLKEEMTEILVATAEKEQVRLERIVKPKRG